MVIFLRSLAGNMRVNYDKMMRELTLTRRSAHSTWCRLKAKHHLRPGDRTAICLPTGRDLDVILTILSCVDEAPEVDYAMMTSFAKISRHSAEGLVSRVKNMFLVGLKRAQQPAAAQPAAAQRAVARPAATLAPAPVLRRSARIAQRAASTQ